MTAMRNIITQSAARAAIAVSDSPAPEAVPTPATVRMSAQLSPQEMADLMGMSLYGYTSWESGARTPGGPALRLLRLIKNDPRGVISALK
jgi:DNA-binding transcriptional regulator YiaG